MTPSKCANIHAWLAEPMAKDVALMVDQISRQEGVEQIAVMPDVHLATQVCVGLVIATRTRIYPAAVGSDIGCGMAAVRCTAPADLLADEHAAARLLAGLYQNIPSLKHGRATIPASLPEPLLQMPLSDPRLEKLKLRDGRFQFGTLGRGNHFLEFQSDDEGQLWLMVHSGSRSMGQAISAHHAAVAARESLAKQLPGFDVALTAGSAYLSDAAWAERYAAENRLAILAAVGELLEEEFSVGIDHGSLIHANHNHVRREVHCGVALWVHRKGALSAQAGEPGLIPGSMGTASFHTIGRGCSAAICSSSHGAGRALSRMAALREIGQRQFLREMQGVWFDQRRSEKLRDEAPSAYKDIHAVMRVQRELTKIVRQLRPLLSFKGV